MAKAAKERGLTEKALGTVTVAAAAAEDEEAAASDVALGAAAEEEEDEEDTSGCLAPAKLRATGAHLATLGAGTREAGGAGAVAPNNTFTRSAEVAAARRTDTFLQDTSQLSQ